MIELETRLIGYQNRMHELERFNKTQITLSNSSSKEEWAVLFGANQSNNSTKLDSQFSTDSYPQAILFNPINELIYVVNQLAATLQIFDKGEKLIQRLLLDENSIPTSSPLAIELNSLNGDVYILGSLSDLLYVVNSSLKLTQIIELPSRPYSLKFNPVNKTIYIQHLIGTIISVVQVDNNFTVEAIETNEIQSGLAINTINGSWTSVAEDDKTLTVYNNLNELSQTYEFIDKQLSHPSYSINGEQILLFDKSVNELISIGANDGEIIQSIILEGTLNRIYLGNQNNYYISLIEPNKIVHLNELLETTASFDTEIPPYVWSVNQTTNVFYISDSINSKVIITNQSTGEGVVSYNDDYHELVSDFKYQPVLVKHLKVSYSDRNAVPLIRVGTKSSAGKRESRLISLHKYNSPQHFSPVYEVTEMDNEIIDGRACWEVLIPPEQSVSMLIYHE